MVVLRRHNDQSVCLAHLGGKVGLLDGFARIVRRQRIEDGRRNGNRLALKSELVMFTTGIGGTARLLATCDRKPPYNSSAIAIIITLRRWQEDRQSNARGGSVLGRKSITMRRYTVPVDSACATMRRNSYKSQLGMRCSEFCGEMVLDDPL